MSRIRRIVPPGIALVLLAACGGSEDSAAANSDTPTPDAGQVESGGGSGGSALSDAGEWSDTSSGGSGGSGGDAGGAAGAAGGGGAAGQGAGGSAGSGGTEPTLTPFEELVTYDQVMQITALDDPYANIDGPMSSYVSGDGNRYWLMPYNYNDGVYLARTGVDAASGFDDLVGHTQQRWGQWDLFTNPMGYPGHWWLVSTYQIDASPPELLSFVHVECWDGACNGTPGRGGIGIAYYKEGANNDQARYMGSKITAKGFPGNHNIQGAPFLVKDGNIYVYYSDRDDAGNARVAVARAELSALIAAARAGQESPDWYKYDNGAWQQPGIDGDFTALNIPGHQIVHSGAAYSTYSNKYYLTTYVNSNQAPAFPGWTPGNYVLLFESADGIDWQFLATLGAASPPEVPGSGGQHYPGFEYLNITPTEVGAWSDGTVGQSFHVYAVWDDGSGPTKLRVYRMTVSL